MGGAVTGFAFTIPGPVVPKQRPRIGRKGHVYTPRETHDYEERVKLCAIGGSAKAGYWLNDNARRGCTFSVVIRVYWRDERRRDLDNAAKGILDALNGLVWADDSQVRELHLYGAVDRTAPRAEVAIERKAVEAA